MTPSPTPQKLLIGPEFPFSSQRDQLTSPFIRVCLTFNPRRCSLDVYGFIAWEGITQERILGRRSGCPGGELPPPRLAGLPLAAAPGSLKACPQQLLFFMRGNLDS